MSRPQFPPRTHRARQILDAVGRAYPTAWQQADHFRRLRGAELPAWPDWCYLPLHGAYAAVSGGGEHRVPYERSHHVGIVGALAAWRMTQGIYRYDPALYPALIETPLDRELPREPLYRLPEWCVYAETPGLEWRTDHERRPIHGVWAHLDWDERSPGRPHDELRLLLDTAVEPDLALDPLAGCMPLPIILGDGTIADALDRVIASGIEQARARGMDYDPALGDSARVARMLWPIVSLLLYVCADDAQIDTASGRHPINPQPVRTRRDGWRLFPAAKPTTWDVGVRLGAALRRAYQSEQTAPSAGEIPGDSSAVEKSRPRAHIRRAHWHGFWRGPRAGERQFSLRWLPPIAVNVDAIDQLPATVRPVR